MQLEVAWRPSHAEGNGAKDPVPNRLGVWVAVDVFLRKCCTVQVEILYDEDLGTFQGRDTVMMRVAFVFAESKELGAVSCK
jgi:hypothetical protein